MKGGNKMKKGIKYVLGGLAGLALTVSVSMNIYQNNRLDNNYKDIDRLLRKVESNYNGSIFRLPENSREGDVFVDYMHKLSRSIKDLRIYNAK